MIFAHLVDQNNRIVAGYDHAPRGNTSPTSAWVPDQRIVDTIVLPLRSDLAAGGTYRLELGMFNGSSQQQLGILGTGGQAISDRILIEPISIAE
jgi:hypothetical protein